MRRFMRIPNKFLIHERWIACIYHGNTPWTYSGWSLRHACGKYAKLDLEQFKKFENNPNLDQRWREWDIKTLSKVPVMFGNQMKRIKRRNPQGVCPRCGEKIPGGLAIWITTFKVRGNS